jgi:GTP-binding protein YchF
MSQLSIGIVGLPNVGKSTLFNALLKKQVALAANYPFATIQPNIGVVEVPDDRLEVLANITQQSEKLVNLPPIKHALVEFVDIAGLVKGASQGEGLGNQFLANIRETQAICHVLRAFEDANVVREGSVSPMEDLAIIRTELQLADLATLNKQQAPKGTVSKEDQLRWSIIENFKQILEQGQNILVSETNNNQSVASKSNLGETEALVAKELCLLTAKPEIFVINVDENDLGQAETLKEKWAKQLDVHSEQLVIISAQIESQLAVLDTKDQEAYLQDLGLEESGLERLAKVAYDVLQLQSFLTAGEIEVKAWTIEKGATARQAAGVIHSDFYDRFISAKVISFTDFVKLGGWLSAKEAGKIRQEGRDYVMQDGDIVEFMVGR